MRKWYFPHGYDIEKESVNNARIETFKDNILESLGRETCQNSIDAAINDDLPVVMVFEEKTLDIGEYIDKDSFINEIIPKSRGTWKMDKKSQEFLDAYESLLLSNKIKVLRIGDYNTTGLEDVNWESLIETAGISIKSDDASAGSFGIGKAAPFASSDLRMVFYNTRTKSGEEKSIGVTKFISFDNEDGTTAQGVGYLGHNKKEPFKHQLSFGFDKREKAGTDLFIIGFNQGNNWEAQIVKSLLENFLVAIYKNMLQIKVGNVVINKNTMGDIIKSYEGKEYEKLKNYYSVLKDFENNKAKKFYLDKSFEQFGFKPEDGELYISKRENANRSVLMTRKAGMKIMDRKRISGSIQFNGIFQAKGDKFNEILKEMENPSHSDWIPSRYEKDPKMAKKLLDAMYRFMKDNVVNTFQEKIDKEVDAFGMNDFLPNKLKEESNNRKEKQDNLDSRVVDIVIRERNKKERSQEVASGEDIEKQLEKAGIIDGDTGGNMGSPLENEVGSKGSDGKEAPGSDTGTKDIGDSDDELVIDIPKKFKEIKLINYKIIDYDYINGEYILNIKSKKDIDKLKIEFNYIGENGNRNEIFLDGVSYMRNRLKYEQNYFILNNILKNNRYIIKFKIPYKHRLKMEVKFYEYK